ncbi:MAG: hypothetical protein BWY81_00994 [Firmicutes bacterium ADurb.Bin467]|nr:MAG: hypothetical protein BWY81_00994 [Firmicutes bacterium ADurb.Bin467]
MMFAVPGATAITRFPSTRATASLSERTSTRPALPDGSFAIHAASSRSPSTFRSSVRDTDDGAFPTHIFSAVCFLLCAFA